MLLCQNISVNPRILLRYRPFQGCLLCYWVRDDLSCAALRPGVRYFTPSKAHPLGMRTPTLFSGNKIAVPYSRVSCCSVALHFRCSGEQNHLLGQKSICLSALPIFLCFGQAQGHKYTIDKTGDRGGCRSFRHFFKDPDTIF